MYQAPTRLLTDMRWLTRVRDIIKPPSIFFIVQRVAEKIGIGEAFALMRGNQHLYEMLRCVSGNGGTIFDEIVTKFIPQSNSSCPNNSSEPMSEHGPSSTDELETVCRRIIQQYLDDETNGLTALLHVIRKDFSLVKYVPTALLENRNFVMTVVGRSGFALPRLPNFQDDREVVSAAVARSSRAILFASDRLRNDERFLAYACSVNGYVMLFLPDRLKDDPYFVSRAVRAQPTALMFISRRLANDAEFIEDLVAEVPEAILFCDPNLRQNKEFLDRLGRRNPDFHIYRNLIPIIEPEPVCC